MRDAVTIGRVGIPPADSPLYDALGCLLLAIFRLAGDTDIRETYEEVARIRVITGDRVRPYIDCISYIGGFSLSLVAVADLKIGANYIIRSERMSGGPN